MSLSWVDWDIGDVTVIALTGRVTLGEGTQRLREAIHEAMQRDRKKLVLNMSEVMYIDSTGLGEMVHAFNLVRGSGGDLKLSKLQQLARDLLQVTRLYTVFEVFPDEDSAVRSFGHAA